MTGRIEAIYVAQERGGEMREVTTARLVTNGGIEGDRHFAQNAAEPGNQVTLIEAEAVERFNEATRLEIDPGAPRRNIVTRGIRLNTLVGKQFSIGTTTLQGIELCEPCATLGKRLATENVDAAQVVRTLVHQAGLRAGIVTGGNIVWGDTIRS